MFAVIHILLPKSYIPIRISKANKLSLYNNRYSILIFRLQCNVLPVRYKSISQMFYANKTIHDFMQFARERADAEELYYMCMGMLTHTTRKQ